MTSQPSTLSMQKFLQYSLVLLSSVLVGIWAMQHTIALRNGLLGLGTILGSIYCFVFFRSPKNPYSKQYSFVDFLPIFMLGLVFFWVVLQYFFICDDPVMQLTEIKSTWFRCFLACVMGFATGLAITKKPSSIACLWWGLFLAICAVYVQYIPRVINSKSLFQPDYSTYFFYGKHNVVMVGTLLIAGLLGGAITQLSPSSKENGTSQNAFCKILATNIVKLLALAFVLFTYVYLFDTRNGIGLAVLILLIAVMLMLASSLFQKRGVRTLANQPKSRELKEEVAGEGLEQNGVEKAAQQKKQKKFSLVRKMTTLLFLICTASVFLYFAHQQMKVNSGWNTFIEDAQIAVQIDRYPNWQNPSVMGYPQTASGRTVVINSYERIAWATAAAKQIIKYPLGNGILHFSLRRSLQKDYPNLVDTPNPASSSHSAWMDLGLTLGFPGLGLILGSILVLLRRFWGSSSPFKGAGLMVCIAILLLYTVAELVGQHGLESLCFWAALLNGLLFWRPDPN